MSMEIRDATTDDIDFIVSANLAMALETEQKHLDPKTLQEGGQRGMQDRVRCRYSVASLDGTLAGTLMVTTEWSDWRSAWFWWIQSVYVRPDARRRGVYRGLYDATLAQARAQGDVCGVRLYVDRENITARTTYEALGMQRATYDLMEVML